MREACAMERAETRCCVNANRSLAANKTDEVHDVYLSYCSIFDGDFERIVASSADSFPWKIAHCRLASRMERRFILGRGYIEV